MSQLAHTHPRRAVEIIDASFRFYRSRFGDLVVISALLLVPPVLLEAIAPKWLQLPIQFAGNFMYLICQGALAVLVAAQLERDETLSAGDVFRTLRGRIGNVIGVSIVSGFMVGLGLIALVVPGVIALAWTAVALPVAAIEGLSSSPAITRSRDLAKGQKRHVLGTLLLVWGIVLLLVFGIAVVLGMTAGFLGLPNRLWEMISGLVIVPIFPLVGIAVALLYYDLRVRSEGADVTALLDALPEIAPEPTAF